MNDGGFGSEIHKLNFKGADGELARFGRDDFAGDRPRLRPRRSHARRPGRGRRARRRAPRARRPDGDRRPDVQGRHLGADPPRALPRHHPLQGGMTAMDFAGRRARFDAALDAAGIDLFFAPPSGDLEYLTGWRRRPPSFGNYEHAHQWAVGAFFRPGRDPVVLVLKAQAAFKFSEGVSGEVIEIDYRDDAQALFADAIGRLGGGRRVGLSARTWASSSVRIQQRAPGRRARRRRRRDERPAADQDRRGDRRDGARVEDRRRRDGRHGRPRSSPA